MNSGQPPGGALRLDMVSARVAPAPPFWQTPLFAALVIVAAGALAYSNALTTPFVFDDEPSLLTNPTIRSFATAWSPPVNGGITVAGRPLLNFSLAVNYAISGTNPWSYHVLNVLIHVTAGLVLFGIVRRTLRRPALAEKFAESANAIAFWAALLWVVHPLQTESVTYVVQRAESLMGLFFLLTLWCFVRACEAGASPRWRWGAIAACLAGMAVKEVMVVVPVILLFYDRTFVAGSFGAAWRERREFYLALSATWLLLAALVAGTGGRGGTFDLADPRAWWRYDLTQCVAIVHYLRLTIWPSPLVIDYGTFWIEQPLTILPDAAIVAGLLAATVWALVRRPKLGFFGAWFFLVLAPSTVLPGTIQMIVEHRMYLPLAAILVVVTTAVHTRWPRWAGVAFGVVAICLIAGTRLRNRDYASEIGLFEQTVAQRPDNARAMALLADYHRRAGQREQARAWLEKSNAIEPNVPAVLGNLGVVCQELGDPVRAIGYFEAALARQPADAVVLGNLGNALVTAGRIDEGIVKLEMALRLAPEFEGVRENLANIHVARARDLQALGQSAEAIGEFQSAVRLRPRDAELRDGLGAMLGRAGRLHEALAQFEEALRIDPADANAQRNAALARQRLGL